MAREGGEREVGAASQTALLAKGGFWSKLWKFLKFKKTQQKTKNKQTF